MNRIAVVVLATYNQKEFIVKALTELLVVRKFLQSYKLEILVIDDFSTDGTAEILREFARNNRGIHVVSGDKNGYGTLTIRKSMFAVEQLHADVVIEMNGGAYIAREIPLLLDTLDKGNDVVIATYKGKNGGLPKRWSFLKKCSHVWNNFAVQKIGGISRTRDCLSGVRAIRGVVLCVLKHKRVRGNGTAYQMDFLAHAQRKNAKITHVPVQFADISGDQRGVASLRKSLFLQAVAVRFPFLKTITLLDILYPTIFFVLLQILFLVYIGAIDLPNPVVIVVGMLTGLLSLQSMYNIYWMIYAWEDSERSERTKIPTAMSAPQYSFTAIIPARHEESVIAQTIQAVSAIDYPESLKETLIVCRSDDTKTIQKVEQTIATLQKTNVRLLVFSDTPVNKPHALNFALGSATKDIVTIFDAEDQPHRDIYSIINTVYKKEQVDVIQAGVQLMNFTSSWFATLNVLEYFFWFKSTLHYFAKLGIVPLGGNTVFFKRKQLETIGGWDENCLTEDADIGIRLSVRGATYKVVYSGKHATQEETPHDLASFIKQRTRWNQGFMQVLFKGEWKKLPRLSQRLLAMYVLILPELQALLFLILPFTIFVSLFFKMPAVFALFTLLPLLLLVLQLIIYTIGLYEFTKEYKLKFPVWIPLKIFLTFLPFQLVLGFSAFRGLSRILTGNRKWEKTVHLNAHRPSFVSNHIASI